jgi:D-threo-aldose 1-dehydrogenase
VSLSPLDETSRTALALPRIGFGAGPLGGFYGPVDAQTGAQAARRAYELGVRYFDVAPLYGHGRAELVLGHALRDLDRDSYLLSTKVGRYLVPAGGTGQEARQRPEGAPFNARYDYSRDGALRALEQSMQRLGTSRIDIVYIHDVDAHSHGSDVDAQAAFAAAITGALPALIELKRSGAIRAVGVGINQPAWALRWLREADLDVLMLAGRLTLLNREAITADVFGECSRRNVAYVAAGPFNGGMLARGQQNDQWRSNYRPASDAVVREYLRLSAIAETEGVSLKAAAIQFVLRHPGVASLVIGASAPREVEENMALASVPVPERFWTRIDDGQALSRVTSL